jgi:hypothetical protein
VFLHEDVQRDVRTQKLHVQRSPRGLFEPLTGPEPRRERRAMLAVEGVVQRRAAAELDAPRAFSRRIVPRSRNEGGGVGGRGVEELDRVGEAHAAVEGEAPRTPHAEIHADAANIDDGGAGGGGGGGRGRGGVCRRARVPAFARTTRGGGGGEHVQDARLLALPRGGGGRDDARASVAGV